VVRGAASDAVTQVIAVATGLQQKFDWVGVAVSGAQAGVGGVLGRAIDSDYGGKDFDIRANNGLAATVAAGLGGGLAGAATRSLITGTDFGDNILKDLPSLIGNTIGSVIGGEIEAAQQDAAVAKLIKEASKPGVVAQANVDAVLSEVPAEYQTDDYLDKLASARQALEQGISQSQELGQSDDLETKVKATGILQKSLFDFYSEAFDTLGTQDKRADVLKALGLTPLPAEPQPADALVDETVPELSVAPPKWGNLWGPVDWASDRAGLLHHEIEQGIQGFLDEHPAGAFLLKAGGLLLAAANPERALLSVGFGLVQNKAQEAATNEFGKHYGNADTQGPQSTAATQGDGLIWGASVIAGSLKLAGGIKLVSAAAGSRGGAVRLEPYEKGFGHHIPAKRMFEGDPLYDPDKALAIPKDELARIGASHPQITGAQASLYSAFSKTGNPLTWDVIENIETKALVLGGGLNPGVASATVKSAIAPLRAAGVSPTKIPWGG
jgi:hypothetical protein